MNIIELAKQAEEYADNVVQSNDNDYAWGFLRDQKFAKLVAAQEREAWEHKFARLQNLMDIREIQPNKPCCLAARAEEREECSKVCIQMANRCDDIRKAALEAAAEAIRARGTT